MSEAITIVWCRNIGTSSSETSSSTKENQAQEPEEKTEVSFGEMRQRQSQHPSKKKPDFTKLVLVKTVLRGELDGMNEYESLEIGSFTRSTWEHLKTDPEMDSEALSA